MILQLHTPDGIINFNTETATDEEYAQYGLKREDYKDKPNKERIKDLEKRVSELEKDKEKIYHDSKP